jgi:MFS family permease
VPPSVVANRPFMWACLAVLAMSAIFFATLFYLPQFFQKILGEDTLMAGLMLLPFVATFALVSFSQNWFLERVGMKAVIVTGATGLFVGPLLFATLIDDASGYSAVVPGMIVLGIGVGFFYSSVTTAGLTSLDPSRSSLAGGLLYMCQIAGGAVGLAICTTVFLEVSSSQIDSDATALGVSLQPGEITDIQGVLAGTDTSAELLSAYPDQSTQLTEIVRDAFVSGMRWTFVLTVVLAAIGLVISILKVGGPISSFGRTQAEIDEVTTLPDAVVGADAADTDSADAVGVAPHPAHRVWHPHRHRHVP